MIDELVVKPIVEELRGKEDFKILVMPDHPTPLALRTHTHDAVPYMIYDSRKNTIIDDNAKYDEPYATSLNKYEPVGHKLMKKFIEEIQKRALTFICKVFLDLLRNLQLSY
jgi:2,3-bisphosphoglycerate-independent phosphoglycerate mutase